MKFISTRGDAPVLSFEEVVLAGLANDGGLYVPETLPKFDTIEIASWATLSYQELVFKIIHPFVDGEVCDDDLKVIIDKAYQDFRHEDIAPLHQLDEKLWVLELFHGPTLAFKDFALQFLGHLLDYFLQKRQQRVVIIGATSGDTGSAAIEGCKRCENIDIFILHPHERVSDVQRRQMTTVLADNVFNIAVEGNFDDCQNMVKASFADQSFLTDGRQLVAVNSINWARIMAQIVYYFYAALKLGVLNRGGQSQKEIAFSVPTGNFGDIFAGYLANKMGLPIERLIIATNQNDILHRCISQNDHSKKPLEHTLSPSMDIMVSSNFERLLFDLYEHDGTEIQRLISDLQEGEMLLSEAALATAKELFESFSLQDKEMLEVIAQEFDRSGYVLDPHTAIGAAAAKHYQSSMVDTKSVTTVCLATAHPAKFPDAVEKAGEFLPDSRIPEPELPKHMHDLFDREERFQILENDLSVIHQYIAKELGV